jgi:hypothetical protein
MVMSKPGTMESHEYYDIHGLVSVDIRGPNVALRRILDRTLAPFSADGEKADFSLNLGSFPSDEWEPSGSTVGDRMLYDPVAKQTTVFNKEMGVILRKSEVQYVIKGEPRAGTGPVEVSVPYNARGVGRLRQAAFETSKLEGRRALLAILGDPIFRDERLELDAEGILQTLLEPFLYYRLVSQNCTLVHGSGLSSNGSGLLIVGLASVGKTSLALQLVKKGYVYYGDDLPILSKTGELISNPKPIKLRPQHVALFPELVDSLTRGMNGTERFLLTRQVRNHEYAFMRRLPRLSLGDIFAGAKMGTRAPLQNVIFLKRVAGKEFFVDELEHDSLVNGVGADLFFQFPCAPWRHTMYYFCPSVALGSDFMAEEDMHHRKIKDILNGAFSRARILRLNAPMGYTTIELEQQITKALS